MARRGNREGSLRKRTDGRWEARVTIDGRQRSFYGATRDKALRKLRNAQQLAEQGVPVPSNRLSTGQFLTDWLESAAKPNVRPRTYESYESHLRVHLIPALGHLPLSKLQPQHVQQLLNEKLDAGLSPNTVVRIRATLRRALGVALKWGLVTRNVAALVDPPKATKYRVEPISPEEAAEILMAVQGHRLEALYVLLLGCGLRLGECLGLTWDNVDLETRQLSVRQSLQKLNKTFRLVEPKSESSRRTLPIPTFVLDVLVHHRAVQIAERRSSGATWQNEWDLVFVTGQGRPLDATNVARAFHRRLAGAGLRRMRLHDLRHGCASLLIAKGVSPRVIMEMLGHSQISLTMNTYAHVLPTLQREAADQMDELIAGVRPH